ncbi:MAG: hypothetical protein HPZ91_06745 [Lentisphaeria bacterium]|nr:hypothetical protein [Lentisphaeria bacterium]
MKTFIALLLVLGCGFSAAGEGRVGHTWYLRDGSSQEVVLTDESVIFIVDNRQERRITTVTGRQVETRTESSPGKERRRTRIFSSADGAKFPGRRSVLSPSGKSFLDSSRKVVCSSSAYGVVLQRMLRDREQGRQAALMLLDQGNSVPADTMSPTVWAVFHLDSRPPDAAPSTETAMALAFVGKWKEAAGVAQRLPADSPDDFGLNLFLGLLSPHDEKLFWHLERAAEINPTKTVMSFDWCLAGWPMTVRQEWDFVDAYLRLLVKHRSRLDSRSSGLKPAAETLLEATREKCYSAGAVLPEYRSLEPELVELRDILREASPETSEVEQPRPKG